MGSGATNDVEGEKRKLSKNILGLKCFQNSLQDKKKYGKIPDRVIGQVWDSISHPKTTVVAIPFALFPNNKIMETLVRAILILQLNIFRGIRKRQGEGIERFSNSLARAPALVFASKIDKIATEEFAADTVKRWKDEGIDVTYKCFEDSFHVKHLQKHPEEYLRLLHAFWGRVRLLERK